MEIRKYLETLGVDGKRFVLLTITPKGKYPTQFQDEDYSMFLNNILRDKESYLGIYEPENKEMMGYVAFTLFTQPLICDKYELPYQTTKRRPRATTKEIEAFLVLKEFYKYVPSEKMNEKEAIAKGIELSKEFLDRFDKENLDCVITVAERHQTGVDILNDLTFNQSNDKYYFDYVYSY
ncbi:hypothetical protein [Bacillus sp. SBS7]|uniref:hypothetical protein n=1 Tax=Bacillus sp. SBS7 TaxID=3401756 RepID=UPI003AA892C1